MATAALLGSDLKKQAHFVNSLHVLTGLYRYLIDDLRQHVVCVHERIAVVVQLVEAVVKDCVAEKER